MHRFHKNRLLAGLYLALILIGLAACNSRNGDEITTHTDTATRAPSITIADVTEPLVTAALTTPASETVVPTPTLSEASVTTYAITDPIVTDSVATEPTETESTSPVTVARTETGRTVSATALLTGNLTTTDNAAKAMYFASCAGADRVAAECPDTDVLTALLDATAVIDALGRIEVPSVSAVLPADATADTVTAIKTVIDGHDNANRWLTMDGRRVLYATDASAAEALAVVCEEFTVITADFVTVAADLDASALAEAAELIYNANHWIKAAPAEAYVTQMKQNRLTLSWTGYPTEYRLSDKRNLTDAEWTTVDIVNGIDYSDFADSGKVYIQLRNAFGSTKTTYIEVENTYRPEKGILLQENFEDTTYDALKKNWTFDPEAFGYDENRSGGFFLENGELKAQWIYGRAMVYKYAIENYRLTCDFRTQGARGTSIKGFIGIRMPVPYTGVSYESSHCDGADENIGAYGIYVCGYGETVELIIHASDSSFTQGAKGVPIYYDLPKGMTFGNDTMQSISIRDEGESVTIYIGQTLLWTVTLSEIAQRSGNAVHTYEEPTYTKAVVTDAKGNVIIIVENAAVPVVGNITIGERGAIFWIDNIEIEKY